MPKKLKTTLSVLAVLGTLSFFVPTDRTQAISQPDAQAPIEAPKIEAPLTLVAALPARAQLPEFLGDPFSGESRKAQPAAKRVAAPPAGAVPAVPVNPYRFAGEVRHPGATQRFLVRGNDILEVKPGDVLDGGYRVDAVEETQVVLVHLVSGHRHAIALGVPGPESAGPAVVLTPMLAAPAPMAAAPVPGEAAPVPREAAPATMGTAPARAGTTPGAPALLLGGSATGIPPKALRKS